MRFDKLKVNGFKSFGDKIEFDFTQNITCIVGPNGCGKSNVVDAVKWVLGEQSSKSLRGGTMEDVIFHGSTTRKPSGVASVTLSFSNPDGKLKPLIDIGEEDNFENIDITRRLYRSGQSEYLINNRAVRLRDIKEMFLDTGVGSNGYSIIEQGRIHQLLQASMEERRQFFDEAAGICLYKSRKKESTRKLDRVEQNLFRLTDIIGEVEKRLRSIKYQAGKARNYQKYSEELQELKSLFFLSRYHQRRLDYHVLQERLEAENKSLNSMKTELGELESMRKGVEVELATIQQHYDEKRAEDAELGSLISGLRERVELQSSSFASLSRQIEVNQARCEDFNSKVTAQKNELDDYLANMSQIKESVKNLDSKCLELRSSRDSKSNALISVKTKIDEERSKAEEFSRRIENLQQEMQEIVVKRDTMFPEKDRFAIREKELKDEISVCGKRREIYCQRQTKIIENINSVETRLEDVKAQSIETADNESSLSRSISESRELRSSMQGKINTLRDMQEHFEGLDEGTTRLLKAKEDGKLDIVSGLLGNYLDTDIENAAVVEAALAGAEQTLIAPNLAMVDQSSEQIREIVGDNGSVDILCLDQVEACGKKDIPDMIPSAECRMLDMIKFEPWLSPLMNHLLGRTFVFRNLSDAIAASASAPEGCCFVTTHGELLKSDGTIRIGGKKGPSGIISRRSELNKLVKELEQVDIEISELDEKIQTTQKRKEEIETALKELWNKRYRVLSFRDTIERRISTVDEKKEDLENEGINVRKRLQEIQEKLEVVYKREKTVQSSLNELREEEVKHKSLLEEMVANISTFQDELEALDQLYNEVRIELASSTEKKTGYENSIATAQRRIKELESEYEAAKTNIESDQERKVNLESEIATAQTKMTEVKDQKAVMEEEIGGIRSRRQGFTDRVGEIEGKEFAQRDSIETLNSAIGDMNIKAAEYDANIGELIRRASEEMNMHLLACYEDYDHDDERDWSEVEAHIIELRGKIERLGNINLDALSEQAELEERHEFLATQIEDVNKSRKELENLVDKLDSECVNRFLSTFAKVRENFQTFFRKLFGGGKADVILEDEENVLESGIEIMARPPGKELRSIVQLSGGEKSMAAAALVFSFFKANPSPFCLLDEVDAALDEANVGRFCEMVNYFSQDTQIIMITHNKRTMSIGDILYGVTMHEPGVSTKISVKFEEAENMIDESNEKELSKK